MRRSRWSSVAWTHVRLALRYLWEGLAYLGAGAAMSAPVAYHLALRAAFRDEADGQDVAQGGVAHGGTDRPAARVPPPGHPERLVTDVPPSAVESRLWAQLTDPGPDRRRGGRHR
jgi:Family of unknown function (DUF6059)